MIAYPTRTAVIERLARKRAPMWQQKANQRTDDHRNVGHYIRKGEMLPGGTKATEFWNEVKSVFVTVQYGKCAYCELEIEAGEGAAIEWDLEHFRPKADVEEWRYKKCTQGRRVPVGLLTGPDMPDGYYLLAYHLGNYLASCKTCNSAFKRTYFPIQNARVLRGSTPAAHQSEGAHLIYLLGDLAEDPRDCIEFHGIEARAKNGSVRGQLLIDFFCLNREGLQRSRAGWLARTFLANFKLAALGAPDAERYLEWMLTYKAPHSACTHCFFNLYLNDRAEAERLHADMRHLLKKSPRF